jgi:hypothetical protein
LFFQTTKNLGFGKKIASPAQSNRISKAGSFQPRLQLEA